MKNAKDCLIVLITAPGLRVARRLVAKALEARLAACANLVPKLESHYWWQGKLERSAEVLLILKTHQRHAKRLEQLILAEHPYDTPEFVTFPVKQASDKYLAWWLSSLAES